MAGGMIPRAGGQGSHAAALAKARLMGYAPPAKSVSKDERKKIEERRKKEKANKKKNKKK
jgi:signal recognition particle subunit SRP54